MTKRILLPVLFFVAAHYGYGQSNSNRPSINLSPGAALPMGDFGKKDLGDASSGFAKLGPSLRAAMKFPTSKRFGLAAELYMQINPIDIKALAKEFNSATFYRPNLFYWDGTTPPPYVPPQTTTFRNWHFEKDKWFMIGLQAGVYADYPFTNGKTSLMAKLMTGATYVHSPKLQGMSIESTQSATIHQESGHGIGFTSSAMFGITHQLNKRLAIKAGIEYLNIPSVRFNDITAIFTTVTGIGGVGGITATQGAFTGDVKQKISTLGINVGLVLKL